MAALAAGAGGLLQLPEGFVVSSLGDCYLFSCLEECVLYDGVWTSSRLEHWPAPFSLRCGFGNDIDCVVDTCADVLGL